jgi:ribonuclease HII
MSLAVSQLKPSPAHALVDGLPVSTLPIPHTAIPKGDCLSYSIAAASVIAKVTRDNMMLELDLLHPGYGFASHKGYGTPEHLDALSRLGPSPIHRRSFAPIRPTQLNLFPYVPLGPHQTHL